jgi:hypothetical protein
MVHFRDNAKNDSKWFLTSQERTGRPFLCQNQLRFSPEKRG